MQLAVHNRAVAAWLLVCCAFVFAIVVVGGVTRLTHSGLSIVEWQPIVGALPPLDDAGWQETFGKYKQTPEYRLVNPGMSLEGFKSIFWWEYVHRLLGRLIGAAFLLPLLWFALRGKIARGLTWKFAVIFGLGALQGALGWYMVKSGLVDNPRVSQYRLTAHLGLAFLIYAAMLWVALDLLFRGTQSGKARGPPAGCSACAANRLGNRDPAVRRPGSSRRRASGGRTARFQRRAVRRAFAALTGGPLSVQVLRPLGDERVDGVDHRRRDFSFAGELHDRSDDRIG